MLWLDEEAAQGRLQPPTASMFRVLLRSGSLRKAEVADLLDQGQEQAMRTLGPLIEAGVLALDGLRDETLALAFPAALAERVAPGLFH